MRNLTLIGALALASVSALAAAPLAMAEEAAAAAPKYSSNKTTIGVLMADPEAKAIMLKVFPEFAQASDTGGSNFERASGMTLPELKAAVGQYAPDLITDARLAQLDAELAKLGAPQPAGGDAAAK